MRRIFYYLMLGMLLMPGLAVAQDAREAAVRTPAERAFILNQMRLFLSSSQAIITAVAEGDMKTVVQEATARGRRGTPASEIPPGMRAKETPAWTSMMGGARAGFDGIAEAAAKGETAQQLTARLGETMHNCVACHQAYRLVEE